MNDGRSSFSARNEILPSRSKYILLSLRTIHLNTRITTVHSKTTKIQRTIVNETECPRPLALSSQPSFVRSFDRSFMHSSLSARSPFWLASVAVRRSPFVVRRRSFTAFVGLLLCSLLLTVALRSFIALWRRKLAEFRRRALVTRSHSREKARRRRRNGDGEWRRREGRTK